MAPVPNSALALNRQQLIEENQQLRTEKQNLQNEISQAQDTLASLQSDISVATQNLTRYKSEGDALVNDINRLKTVHNQLETKIGLQDDTGEYPAGSLNHEKIQLENTIVELEETAQKREEETANKTKQMDEKYQKHKAKIEKNIKEDNIKDILDSIDKKDIKISNNKKNNNIDYLQEISNKMADELKPQTIELTDYEKMQEENAIISYKELITLKDKIMMLDDDDETVNFIEELKKLRNSLK